MEIFPKKIVWVEPSFGKISNFKQKLSKKDIKNRVTVIQNNR